MEFNARDGATYDMLHSHYWLSGLVGEKLKATWNVPHVTMFHTLGEVKNRSSYNEHETALRIESEAAVIAGADRVICATETRSALSSVSFTAPIPTRSQSFRSASTLSASGLRKNLAREALGLKDERIVLFVGRIEPLKGVDILIDAAALLDSDVDCSVLIVGGDESSKAQVQKLRDLARDRGIGHRVVFVGAVDHDNCRCTTTPPMSASCHRTTRASASSPSRRWRAACLS